MADLSPAAHRPSWRIHDRTHLEFAVDYEVGASKRRSVHEWEAYFFIPESLRVEPSTYGKADIYADLQSYVRFAVPDVSFADVAKEPLERVTRVTRAANPAEITRELRLFACVVRSAGVAARRTIADALESGDPDERSRALAASARMVADCRHITVGLRAALATLSTQDDDTLRTAAEWVDEDISRLIETLMGSLAVRLKKAGAPESLRSSAIEAAVAEARYRRSVDLDSVGHVGSSKREVEHLEFRRHVLKRFTSSVLWLRPHVSDAARIVLQVLYALAAGVAMAFAVAAALLNGDPRTAETIWIWCAIAVVAYMGKDRIKAILQNAFSSVVSRHFPDRRWRVEDERKVQLGKVDERSAFVPFRSLPEDVLAKRRSTRRHPLEEQARPEKVLWHRKTVSLDPKRVAQADDRFHALTEIFRLDLRKWLVHTDDPKRKIVFADPEASRVLNAVAPRVYNIGIVYRLRRKGDNDAPWHRLRVVVSRKGIRRIDHIDPDDPMSTASSGWTPQRGLAQVR